MKRVEEGGRRSSTEGPERAVGVGPESRLEPPVEPGGVGLENFLDRRERGRCRRGGRAEQGEIGTVGGVEPI